MQHFCLLMLYERTNIKTYCLLICRLIGSCILRLFILITMGLYPGLFAKTMIRSMYLSLCRYLLSLMRWSFISEVYTRHNSTYYIRSNQSWLNIFVIFMYYKDDIWCYWAEQVSNFSFCIHALKTKINYGLTFSRNLCCQELFFVLGPLGWCLW